MVGRARLQINNTSKVSQHSKPLPVAISPTFEMNLFLMGTWKGLAQLWIIIIWITFEIFSNFATDFNIWIYFQPTTVGLIWYLIFIHKIDSRIHWYRQSTQTVSTTYNKRDYATRPCESFKSVGKCAHSYYYIWCLLLQVKWNCCILNYIQLLLDRCIGWLRWMERCCLLLLAMSWIWLIHHLLNFGSRSSVLASEWLWWQ